MITKFEKFNEGKSIDKDFTIIFKTKDVEFCFDQLYGFEIFKKEKRQVSFTDKSIPKFIELMKKGENITADGIWKEGGYLQLDMLDFIFRFNILSILCDGKAYFELEFTDKRLDEFNSWIKDAYDRYIRKKRKWKKSLSL